MGSIDKAIQGTADGLCGIYSLINFCVMNELFADQKAAFRYLCESAERLRLLSAAKIVDGYEDHELVEIFNHAMSIQAIDYRAILIASIKKKLGRTSNFELANKVHLDGGSVVVAVERKTHWVLATGVVGSGPAFNVIDSTYGNNALRKIDSIRFDGGGLAILPVSVAEDC